MHRPVAQLLVDRGANVNAALPATDGWTPLHLAAWAGNVSGIRFLLAAPGIEPALGGWCGQTPLQAATYGGHQAAADALRRASGGGGGGSGGSSKL